MKYREFPLGWAAATAAAMVVCAALPAGAQPVMIRGGQRVMIAGGGDAAAVKNDKTGLHIPQGHTVGFTYNMTDGAGFRWDIQYYGTVGQGTNYAYSGGLYLHVDGSSVHSNGRGWMNEKGDEVEIGPFNRGNVNVYRRIKVYKDQGLARWLDIFENPTSKDVTVNARVYTSTNWQIGNQITSSGGNQFGEKDFAFITQTQGGNAPAVMHYVCGDRSKVRPSVNIQNNQIFVNYNVSVPANGTAVVCYFESQCNSTEELTKLMKSLKPYKVLKDLPASVRKLIVNMPSQCGIGGVELSRTESADSIVTAKGDPLFGRIENPSFSLDTLFGPMTLSAEKVVGMAAVAGEPGQFRVLLTGGQTLAGSIAKDQKLRLTITTGGELSIPFADLQQAAYRISENRPEDAPFAAPIMILRTGDRVSFDGNALALQLRTRHGIVPIRAADMLSITMDNPGNGVHRANFLNGSQLAGFLEPQSVPVTLALGPKLSIPRSLISEVVFAAEEKPDETLDCAKLTNGDVLFGRLVTPAMTIRTDYNPLPLKPENIKSITFSRTELGRAAVVTWDGTTPRGMLSPETLSFQLMPGPKVDLYVGQCLEIVRCQTEPPGKIMQRVEKLVAQLGAESYKDREAATKALMDEGKGVLPYLKKHLDAGDPEVRQRLQNIIDKIEGNAAPNNNNPNGFPGGIMLQ